MRNLMTVILVFWAGTAAAHTGHWGEMAGHDHWVAGAAIGIAILVGLAGALKGQKKTDEAVSDDAETDEEVPA